MKKINTRDYDLEHTTGVANVPSYPIVSQLVDFILSHRSCAEATKKPLLFIRCRHLSRKLKTMKKKWKRRCENSKAMSMFWAIEANAWNPFYRPLLDIWTSKRTKMNRTKILWIDLMHFIYMHMHYVIVIRHKIRHHDVIRMFLFSNVIVNTLSVV